MKRIITAAAILLAAIVNANAAISLEVFEDNSLIIAFGPVTGGSISVLGASTADFSNISVTVTGNPMLPFPELSLDVSAATAAGFSGTHNLTILATQIDVPANTGFTNFFTVTNNTGGSQVTMANFANAANQPFAQTLSISPVVHFFSTGNLQFPDNTSLVAKFAETILMSIDASQPTTINGTAIVAGVPEPATWAMMLIGFAGLALVLRNRRRSFAI
jgi:PEP-CTERM motif